MILRRGVDGHRRATISKFYNYAIAFVIASACVVDTQKPSARESTRLLELREYSRQERNKGILGRCLKKEESEASLVLSVMPVLEQKH